jgi:MFS family permease
MPRIRWLMVALCCVANMINYIDRANLAVAAPILQREFHFSPVLIGLLLSGFFWTYSVMQLPFGWIADRIGARLSLTIAVLWWSTFTAVTALARGFAGLFGCRLLLGVGEAGAYPSFAKVGVSWFPKSERAITAGIFDSGSRAGAAMALPLCAWLVGTYGWRISFVVTGALGVAWVVVWLLVYREPQDHPAVSAGELAALRAAQDKPAPRAESIRWLALFRYRTIWGLMIGFFSLNFVIYFFITWFPTYLMQARGFSLNQMGTLGFLPAAISVPCEWLGGWTSDTLHRRGWSLTAARKTCLVGGMLLSSVITLSAFVSSAYLALALFALAYSALTFTAANIWSLPSDVAPTPRHVASISGIQNCAANLAGIVTTTFTGVMLMITKGSFLIPLSVAGGFCVLGALVYLFLVGKIEPLRPDVSVADPVR